MPAYKLFISHSSRPDIRFDPDNPDANWTLLGDVCRELKAIYGPDIDILVDRDGLIPGDRWEAKLHRWIHECHGAVILCSKRALEASDWVKQEATLLAHRARIDPEGFRLIPVTLQGQSTPDSLRDGYFGVIGLDASQCTGPFAPDATAIAQGIRAGLGTAEDLRVRANPTPYDRLRARIASVLPQVDAARLNELLDRPELRAPFADRADTTRLYESVARALVDPAALDPLAFFALWRGLIELLERHPDCALRRAAYEIPRSLWVNPAAAAALPIGLREDQMLIFGSAWAHWGDEESCAFTVSRYFERLGPRDVVPIIVKMMPDQSEDDVKGDIQEALGMRAWPPPLRTEDGMVDELRRTLKPVILVAYEGAEQSFSGPPDPRFVQKLERLRTALSGLLVLVAVVPGHEDQPGFCPAGASNPCIVHPPLDSAIENAALMTEGGINRTLNDCPRTAR